MIQFVAQFFIKASSRKAGESWPRSTVEFLTFDRKFLIVWDLSIVCQHLTYNFVIIDKLIKGQSRIIGQSIVAIILTENHLVFRRHIEESPGLYVSK